MQNYSSILIAIILVISTTSTALSEAMTSPTGDIILTISGSIGHENSDGAALFDIEMLEALPQRSMTAETPWYDQEVTFKGALTSEILKLVAARGSMVEVKAINGYSSVMPIEEFGRNGVILATRLDGNTMSVRDRGPLFLAFPFDLDKSLYNEVYFGRSVWQIDSIVVR